MNPARLARLPQISIAKRPLTRASARILKPKTDPLRTILHRLATDISGKNGGLAFVQKKLKSLGFEATAERIELLMIDPSAERPLIKTHLRMQPYERPHGVNWINQIEDEAFEQQSRRV